MGDEDVEEFERYQGWKVKDVDSHAQVVACWFALSLGLLRHFSFRKGQVNQSGEVVSASHVSKVVDRLIKEVSIAFELLIFKQDNKQQSYCVARLINPRPASHQLMPLQWPPSFAQADPASHLLVEHPL